MRPLKVESLEMFLCNLEQEEMIEHVKSCLGCEFLKIRRSRSVSDKPKNHWTIHMMPCDVFLKIIEKFDTLHIIGHTGTDLLYEEAKGEGNFTLHVQKNFKIKKLGFQLKSISEGETYGSAEEKEGRVSNG